MAIQFDSDALAAAIIKATTDAIQPSTIMPEIAQLLIASVEKNIQVGGRFSVGASGEFTGGTQQWKPSKKKQGATLVGKGLMAKSVDAIWSGNTLTLTSNRVYSRIQQEGGTINHPGGTPYIILGKGLARFIKKSSVDKQKKKVKYTKAHKITLPARPYLVVQDEDVDQIVAIIAKRMGG